MTDSFDSIVHTLDAPEPALARREWELCERIDELQSALTERIERERIRELELMSQRHELEVRFTYNAMLEERVVDHADQIAWLHKHADGEAERFAVEARYANQFQRERDEIRAELDAERRRLSYRVVQRLVSRMKKHRVISALLGRAARVISR